MTAMIFGIFGVFGVVAGSLPWSWVATMSFTCIATWPKGDVIWVVIICWQHAIKFIKFHIDCCPRIKVFQLLVDLWLKLADWRFEYVGWTEDGSLDRMNCEAILSPPAVWEIYFDAMILSTKKSIVHSPDRQHVVQLITDVQKLKLNKYGNICEWMCWNAQCYFCFLYILVICSVIFSHVPGCVSQPIPLCQVLAIQEVNDDPWICISHFEYIVATVCQHKSGRERGCTPNWKRLRKSISLVKALLCGLLLLRSLANTVCYFERLPPTSWPTKATFRPHDVTMSHTLWDSQMFLWCIMCMSWCIMRFMCMSFRFFVWRWRMAVSFRWATLWPRSPWLCHGPQTSCKAFLASTDSLRPNAKRKELLEKKRKSSSRKRESRNLNQM